MLNVIGVKDICRYQELALQSRLRIPFNFRTGCYPRLSYRISRPLAEAASFDLAMIEEAARYNALESAADGLNWVLPRWWIFRGTHVGDASWKGAVRTLIMVLVAEARSEACKETIWQTRRLSWHV